MEEKLITDLNAIQHNPLNLRMPLVQMLRVMGERLMINHIKAIAMPWI
jgi:hypothetical protein